MAARPALPGLWAPAHRALVTGLLLCVVLTAFEILAVATVMPIVVPELGGLELYGWAVAAFFLGSLPGTVIVGGLLDRGGLLGAFVGSLALFGVGLLLAGTAGSMPVLVAARFIQGLGGGALTPIAYVAIGRGLPESLRPRMFAAMSTAWILPAVLGPGAAGVIAQVVSWRVVFLGLIPGLIVAGLLTAGAISRVAHAGVPGPGEAGDGPAEAEGSGPAGAERPRGADAVRRAVLAIVVTVGAALFTAGLASDVPVAGGPDGPVPSILVQAAVTGFGFLLIAAAFRRLTPPGTLRLARGLPAAIASRGLLMLGFYALDAYVALALIGWRGLPAAVAGIALAAGSVCWTLGSWTQARWALRIGYPRLVRAGFASLTTGIAVFAVALEPGVPVAVGFLAFAAAGFGMGLAYAPQSLVVLRDASPAEQGSASAALNLADLLGTALGAALSGAILAAGLRGGAQVGEALLPAFVLAAVITATGLAVAGRLAAPRSATDRPTPLA
jgi:MFS family permease